MIRVPSWVSFCLVLRTLKRKANGRPVQVNLIGGMVFSLSWLAEWHQPQVPLLGALADLTVPLALVSSGLRLLLHPKHLCLWQRSPDMSVVSRRLQLDLSLARQGQSHLLYLPRARARANIYA